jgi:TetR/AcrR family transcriptional regulator
MNTKKTTTTAKDKKSIRTRENIMRAARKVFSEHPFHTASMRMIGKEARIEHPLINYYFPNKAVLFETIVQDLCDEFARYTAEWLDEASKARSISEGFMKHIDRMIDYNSENPEPLRILALNLTQADNISLIPGYQRFPQLIEKVRELFIEKIKPAGPESEISMFINSFNFLTISFLGSNTCIAQIQGMEPGGKAYREWVKNTLGFIFLPRLKDIIVPDTAEGIARRKKSAK